MAGEYYEHWSEKETITALDLVEAEEAYEGNFKKQSQAWTDYVAAQHSVKQLKRMYDDASWNADVAKADLESIRQAIKEQENA